MGSHVLHEFIANLLLTEPPKNDDAHLYIYIASFVLLGGAVYILIMLGFLLTSSIYVFIL